MTARGLLVAGTTSDAGKSLLVTGICRYLAGQGLRVAPFKAQNMSNNSMVCPDGSEIGRAQYLQAQAARATPESAMNPVLLKPGSDRVSHVVVRGRPAGTLAAGEFATGRQALREAAFSAYEELAERYEVIVCEGAGSPAEINLRAGDYVNMGLAQRFGLPTIVVGDIDRGGVFAALYGTLALLEPADRDLVKAFVINKFRGDESLLAPALTQLADRTGVPFWGVVPWLPGVWLDSEDTLSVHDGAVGVDQVERPLRVAVIRLPRLSNATDVDALATEPGVEVTMTADPVAVRSADVVVLPGSRATVSDLGWLRSRGLATAIEAAARAGVPVVGICGGFQMLATTIEDAVESGAAQPVRGLGLLPVQVGFQPEKVLATTAGSWSGYPVTGYEIHHGVATVTGPAESFPGGCRSGSVWGTMWHGIFENDAFRRAWLRQAALARGLDWTGAEGAAGYQSLREQMIDRLADAVAQHLDTGRLRAALALPDA